MTGNISHRVQYSYSRAERALHVNVVCDDGSQVPEPDMKAKARVLKVIRVDPGRVAAIRVFACAAEHIAVIQARLSYKPLVDQRSFIGPLAVL